MTAKVVEERDKELEEAWRGNPKNLSDAIRFDLFELIPVLGQVSRFQAGIEAKQEDVKIAFGSTWIIPVIPVRTIRYLEMRRKGK